MKLDTQIAWHVLSMLFFSGKKRELIEASGGPVELLLSNQQLLFQIKKQRHNTFDRSKPICPDQFKKFQASVSTAVNFVSDRQADGVAMLGLQHSNELGRCGRAKSPPLMLYARGNAQVIHHKPAIASRYWLPSESVI